MYSYFLSSQNGVNANFSGSIKPTGSVDSVNNIYDMSGNLFDWTAEAISTGYRLYRGYYYGTDSSIWYAGYRDNHTPTKYYNYYGSRMSLYIKDPYISSKADELICNVVGRNFYKYNNEEAITGFMFFRFPSDDTRDFSTLILVSKSKDAVKYYTDYDNSVLGSSGSIQYNGEKYYYSSIGQWMSTNDDYITNYPLINTPNNKFSSMEDAALRLLQIYFEE